MSDDAPPAPGRARPIRSFVLRAGRLTAGQARALDELAPALAPALADLPRPLDLDALFGRRASRVLEIGCGNGEALTEMAATEPEVDFLGAEVYPPGIGQLLLGVEARGLRNVRVLRADAREVLAALAGACLDATYILFPDPWPKKRHHKRRLVNDGLCAQLARVLHPGGMARLATDDADYAGQMRAVFAANPDFAATTPLPRPLTKYERRARRLGNAVTDLAYIRR